MGRRRAVNALDSSRGCSIHSLPTNQEELTVGPTEFRPISKSLISIPSIFIYFRKLGFEPVGNVVEL